MHRWGKGAPLGSKELANLRYLAVLGCQHAALQASLLGTLLALILNAPPGRHVPEYR